MTQACDHLPPDLDLEPPLRVCSACVEIGSGWVHLRQCLACGRTLCCDNSPNRHATAHFRKVGHPMIRTAEPEEDWLWCYPDDIFYLPGPRGYEVAEE
jgi:uncharacterized UBP type Zn finger protein